jgi:formate hydrogenlyase transcriptional activator
MDGVRPKTARGNLLIADDELSSRQSLAVLLNRKGYEVRCAPNGGTALKSAAEAPPELILLDVRLPDMDGYQICRRLRKDPRTAGIPVIFISALQNVVDKVKGFAAGGVDYLPKPFHDEELLARVETHLALKRLREQVEAQNARLRQEIANSKRAEEAFRKAHDELEGRVKERTADLARSEENLKARLREIEDLKHRLEKEDIYLRGEVGLLNAHEEIIGQSEAIRHVLAQVEKVAPTDSIVLITGETGTGKELIARAIHNLSNRRSRLMVTINCASLPPTLIESELFGREKGAYTGALTRQSGRFEMADGSTLFLDEIGELPLELQAKLLKVLQNGEFERVGSSATLKVNVRVIAATNRNLPEEMRLGRFRQDLFYRLSVFPIKAPPLRDHPEDIPLLINSFAEEFAKRMGKKIQSVPRKTMEEMQRYSWPGNVRELRNFVEQAFIIGSDDTLRVQLPREETSLASRTLTADEMERQHIVKVLEMTKWKIKGRQGAAEILGLKPSTLYSRMVKMAIPSRRQKDEIKDGIRDGMPS